MRKGEDYIQTYTGKIIYPLNPREEDIDILDIAHALSMLCRYGGHCREFYSVADHCVNVSNLVYDSTVGKSCALWGLLHDASEAYLMDIPAPIKHSNLMRPYRVAEKTLMLAISRKFLYGTEEPAIVRSVDRAILTSERLSLMPVECKPGKTFLRIIPKSPAHAEAAFLERFYDLTGA